MANWFTVEEFACKCGCGFASPHTRLVELLDSLRSVIGAPIHVLSGCRCPQHNATVGGRPNSFHLNGMAADIVVDMAGCKFNRTEILTLLLASFNGVIEYEDFFHVDVRPILPYRKTLKGE